MNARTRASQADGSPLPLDYTQGKLTSSGKVTRPIRLCPGQVSLGIKFIKADSENEPVFSFALFLKKILSTYLDQ